MMAEMQEKIEEETTVAVVSSQGVGQDDEPDKVAALLLDVDGYEGPIDVLLELARNQKVDLATISILQLVRQYLEFIDRAKEQR